MKTRTYIFVGLVALSVSGVANAAPKGLDQILSRFVSAAVSVTTEELKNEVAETILNSAHHVEQTVPTASVAITDLSVTEQSED